MEVVQELAAIEAIKKVKARYFRGVDSQDGALVRSILAENCILDYNGCGKDPVTGIDYLPAFNRIISGRDAWPDAAPNNGPRLTSVHQGHDPDITIESPYSAMATWAFTDRLYFPEDSSIQHVTGWGCYHETYVNESEDPTQHHWKQQTTRITRYRVEAVYAGGL